MFKRKEKIIKDYRITIIENILRNEFGWRLNNSLDIVSGRKLLLDTVATIDAHPNYNEDAIFRVLEDEYNHELIGVKPAMMYVKHIHLIHKKISR